MRLTAVAVAVIRSITNANLPSPLRSGHLDIKDAQCAKKNDGRKFSYNIIPRLGAAGVRKGRIRRPKFQLSSKVAKFHGRLELI